MIIDNGLAAFVFRRFERLREQTDTNDRQSKHSLYGTLFSFRRHEIDKGRLSGGSVGVL